MVCLHESESACLVISTVFSKPKGLLKVTACHVHCICGNISETVPDRVVVTMEVIYGLSNSSLP